MNDNTEKTQTIWVEEKNEKNFISTMWNTFKWVLFCLIVFLAVLLFLGWVTTGSFSGNKENIDPNNVKNLVL
jgi:hypothetical protein